MVQFNLLPDIKMQYIKAQRTRHLVTFIATLASIISIGLLLLALFFVYGVQRQLIRGLDDKIKKSSSSLKQVEDVDKILTVQNQLNSLTGLHENKPTISRVFGYLQKTTPEQVSLNKLQLDFSTSMITVGGTAPSLDAVKVYANALKAAKYTVGDDTARIAAFTEVVLTNFSKDDKGTAFTITAKFNVDLFDTTKTINLEVAGSNNSVFGEGQ